MAPSCSSCCWAAGTWASRASGWTGRSRWGGTEITRLQKTVVLSVCCGKMAPAYVLFAVHVTVAVRLLLFWAEKHFACSRHTGLLQAAVCTGKK